MGLNRTYDFNIWLGESFGISMETDDIIDFSSLIKELKYYRNIMLRFKL